MKKMSVIKACAFSLLTVGAIFLIVSCGRKKNSSSVLPSSYQEESINSSVSEAKSVTLKFNTLCDDIEVESMSGYAGESLELPQPVRTGYDFLGWYKDSLFKKVYVENTYPENDTVLYAKWSIKEFNLTFDLYDDGNKNVILIKYGSEITFPTASREGYSFLGWYDKTNDRAFQLKTMPERDVYLVGKWATINYYYDYELDGGTNNSKNVSVYNVEIDDNTLYSPVKYGYKFDGWYLDNNYSKRVYTYPKENVTFYAKWVVNKHTLTLTSDYEAAYEGETKEYNFGDVITLPELSAEGGEFIGWYLDDTLYETTFTMLDEDVTLIGKWDYTEYHIEYECYGGKFVSTDSYFSTFNASTKKELPTPNKTGYTFVGWYLDENLNIPFVSYLLKDMKVYAKYKPIYYTLHYDTGCELSYDDLSLIYETEVTLVTPEREGYTFIGWFTDNGSEASGSISMPNCNVTLHASWQINTYMIQFVTPGCTYNKYYNYNDTVILESELKDYYEFLGWYENDVLHETEFTMPAYNLTLNGKYKAIEYTCTYTCKYEMTNDNPTTYTVNSDLVLVDPIYKGYTFLGWYETDASGNEIMVTELPLRNVTLEAKFELAEYTITYHYYGTGVQGDLVTSYTYFDNITLPEIVREYSDFYGWYTDETYSTKIEIIPYGSSGNLNLYAKEKDYFVVDGNTIDGVTDYANEKLSADNLVIPSSIDGTEITTISCLGANSVFKKVTLSEGIKVLGDSCFSDWSELVSISLPSSLRMIGSHAFAGTKISNLDLSSLSSLSLYDEALASMDSLLTLSVSLDFAYFNSALLSETTPLETINYPGTKQQFEKNIASTTYATDYKFGPSTDYKIVVSDDTTIYKDKTCICGVTISLTNKDPYKIYVTFPQGVATTYVFPVCEDEGFHYIFNGIYETYILDSGYVSFDDVTVETELEPYMCYLIGTKDSGYLTYTVYFENAEGSDLGMTSMEVNYGDEDYRLPEIFKDGYYGITWYKTKDFQAGSIITFIRYENLTSNLKIYMDWKPIYVLDGDEIAGITDYYAEHKDITSSYMVRIVPFTYEGKLITKIGTSFSINYSSKRPSYSPTTVYIGDGITTIKESAFYQFKNVTTIRLPGTLTSIGEKLFDLNNTCNSCNVTYNGTVAECKKVCGDRWNICYNEHIDVICTDGKLIYNGSFADL